MPWAWPPLANHLPSGLNAMASTCLPVSIVRSGAPSEARQKRIVESSPPVTSKLPSGLKSRPTTAWLCPSRVLIGVPPLTSHSRTDASKPPLASRLPSGLKRTTQILRVWPLSSFGGPARFRSQMRTTLSSPPLASCARSGETSRVQIVPWAVPRVRTSLRCARSHSRTVPSYPELKRRDPSRLKTTAVAPSGWWSCSTTIQLPVSRIVIVPDASLIAASRPSLLKSLPRAGAATGQLAASDAVIRGPVVTGGVSAGFSEPSPSPGSRPSVPGVLEYPTSFSRR